MIAYYKLHGVGLNNQSSLRPINNNESLEVISQSPDCIVRRQVSRPPTSSATSRVSIFSPTTGIVIQSTDRLAASVSVSVGAAIVCTRQYDFGRVASFATALWGCVIRCVSYLNQTHQRKTIPCSWLCMLRSNVN